MATAPINKKALQAAGHLYPGHTELLAALTGTAEVRMMLVGSRLRVILVTTHMALSQVPAALSSERIVKTITMATAHLSRFHGLVRPRLVVAGLNPHAGEDGAFGDEEKRIIATHESGHAVVAHFTPAALTVRRQEAFASATEA